MSRIERLADDVVLYLADCREVLDDLPSIDAIVTDPPYGMAFQSNYRKVKHAKLQNDSDTNILEWTCHLKANHSKYVFCRWDNLYDVPKPRSLVTWVKNNWSMGDLQHEHGRQTEVALFYPGPDHFFPAGRPSDVLSAKRTGNDHHGTEKPEGLMLNVVRWTDGVVIDPFCGSGTTGIAAVQLGRPFIGIELDQTHFETALRRVEKALRNPGMFAVRKAPAMTQEAMW